MPRVSITIAGKNSQPYRFTLDRKKVSIGRGTDCDIVIDCPSVSSLHCTMERVDGGYILRDRKSTNGITLDEEAMAIIDLRNNNDVKVGDVEFGYELSDEELDDLDEEEFVPQEKKMSEVIEKAKKAKASENQKALNKVASGGPPPPQTMVQPMLASSNSDNGGFLFAVAVFVCGGAAFVAGMSNSYSGSQRKLGREGEISLVQDIREGRPPLVKEKEKEEEEAE
ncbi:MAG: FHA domain-containing protein [Akkermansiaceae bacterium]|nr:FHA domain-containing protein [Akkermansiaceae bacterium]